MTLRGLRIAGAVAALVITAGATAQTAPPPPSGVVPAGQIAVRCPDSSCAVQVSGVNGTASLPADSGTVLSGIPGGEHTVTIRTGSERHNATVRVCGERVTLTATSGSIEATKDTCAPFGYLRLSVPAAASVTVDGNALAAKGSQTVPVYAGSVRVAVGQKGFKTFTTTVQVRPGQVAAVAGTPLPLPAIVMVTGLQGVDELTVDGSAVLEHGTLQHGSVTASRQGAALQLQLQPGKHVLHASRANYAPFDETYRFQSDAHTKVALAFQPLPAKVTFKVWPTDATVRVDGTIVDASGPVRLPTGKHQATISAPSFQTQTRTVSAGANQKLTVSVTLVGKPVSVVIDGAPPGARVQVDGGPATDIGQPLKVRPGPHTLTLRAKGFVTIHKKIVLGTAIVQSVQVSAIKKGRVEAQVVPGSGRLAVDGAPVPLSSAGAATLTLDPGPHSLVASAPHYQPRRAQVTVEAGQMSTLTLSLVPEPALITLHGVPPGATVSLDGTPVEPSDGTVSVAQPGQHHVTVGSAALVPKTFPVTTQPGAQLSLDVGTFEQRPATVVLQGLPAKARILVDNGDVTAYDGPIQLPAGSHTIWVAADGYTRAKLDVALKAGEHITLRPQLKPLQQP